LIVITLNFTCVVNNVKIFLIF